MAERSWARRASRARSSARESPRTPEASSPRACQCGASSPRVPLGLYEDSRRRTRPRAGCWRPSVSARASTWGISPRPSNSPRTTPTVLWSTPDHEGEAPVREARQPTQRLGYEVSPLCSGKLAPLDVRGDDEGDPFLVGAEVPKLLHGLGQQPSLRRAARRRPALAGARRPARSSRHRRRAESGRRSLRSRSSAPRTRHREDPARAASDHQPRLISSSTACAMRPIRPACVA